MIEVFKTNVNGREQAKELVEMIHRRFPGYQANFDLDDCDRILRIVSEDGLAINQLKGLILRQGFSVELLPD